MLRRISRSKASYPKQHPFAPTLTFLPSLPTALFTRTEHGALASCAPFLSSDWKYFKRNEPHFSFVNFYAVFLISLYHSVIDLEASMSHSSRNPASFSVLYDLSSNIALRAALSLLIEIITHFLWLSRAYRVVIRTKEFFTQKKSSY